MLKRLRTHEFTGWIETGLKWAPLNPEDEAFQRMISAKGEPLLHCRGRDIYRVNLELDGSPCPCFLFVFRNSSFTRSFRLPSALRILRISRQIRQLGFPSLEVLAAFRPKYRWLNRGSLLVAKEIPDVRELPSSGNHIYRVHDSAEFSEFISDLTAFELARFHDSHIFHGDLKSRHVLISGDPEVEHPDIFFVDLEKTCYQPRLPSFLKDLLAARDLVQLLSSLPGGRKAAGRIRDKSGFLSRYLDSRDLTGKRRKRIRKTVCLYLESGRLRQGETLLRGILRMIVGGKMNPAD